jgi:nucleoside-diphosphate-sugar epimerase
VHITNPSIPALEDLLQQDLDYICGNLKEEFGRMAGQSLLITGGAGFLGYYLVLAALHFNRTTAGNQPIHVTVWDNFIRGTPAWLTGLRGTPNLAVERRDLIEPLPQPMPDFQWIIHAAGIASPPFYRKHPIKTIDANINGLRNLLDYSLVQASKGKPVNGFLFYSSSEIYGDPGYRRPSTTAAWCLARVRERAMTNPSVSARPCAWSSPSSMPYQPRWPGRSTTTAPG